MTGTCNYDNGDSSDWSVALCDCPLGYRGDSCEIDDNACIQEPCFTSCTDVAAADVSSLLTNLALTAPLLWPSPAPLL